MQWCSDMGPSPAHREYQIRLLQLPMLAVGSPDVTSLIESRGRVYRRLRELRAAGLLSQSALALLRQRTGSDYDFLARTCGIPQTEGAAMDAAAAGEVQHCVGQADLNGIARKRIILAADAGGLGLQSVELTSPAAQAASCRMH